MTSAAVRSWITLATILLLSVTFVASAPGAPLTVHVAIDGNDGAAGTAESPLQTLTGARDHLREIRAEDGLAEGATVLVHSGSYRMQQPLTLTEEDSGTEDAPIVYRSAGDGPVELMGGVAVSGWEPHEGYIMRADVSALGISDIPPMRSGFFRGDVPGVELIFNGRRQPLARWPDKDADDPRLGKWALIQSAPENQKRRFVYAGDRPEQWARPELAQVSIWPHYNYRHQYVGVESVDAEQNQIVLASDTSYNIQPGRRYYVRNVFEELDAPGEWYLDREEDVLYFWPPGPLSEHDAVISKLETAISLQNTSWVTIRGMTISACRGTAVTIEGGEGNSLAGCTIRNIQGNAVSIDGGRDNGAVGNDIHHIGLKGILLSGGNRETLTPAGNYADNNHIHHMSQLVHTYMSGVHVRGCGNRVTHNLIHHCPHMAMGLSGNDHILEYNEIHHAMVTSSHGGAFYTGRDFSYRGNIIRYNSFHDIYGYGIDHIDQENGVFVYRNPVVRRPGAFAVHLDDLVSGFHIHGNLFYRLAHGAIRLGGGRNVTVENNIFADAGWGMHIDNRGMTWAEPTDNATVVKRLKAMPYQQPPWSERYPELLTLLEDRPGEPLDNAVRSNIFIGSPPFYNLSRISHDDRVAIDENVLWSHGEPVRINARFYDGDGGGTLSFEQWREHGYGANSIVADPRFVGPAYTSFRVHSDSPALERGFEQIPVDQIGLYEDDLRASWPPPPKVAGKLTAHAEPVVVTYPISGGLEPTAEHTVLQARAPRIEDAVSVDGQIAADAWGTVMTEPLVLDEDPAGSPVDPPALAWVCHDAETLYVAFSVPLGQGKRPGGGERWGQDDAVEVALAAPASDADAPIVVLRGFPTGKLASSTEAGAPKEMAEAVGEATRFAATARDGGWTAELAIPLAALDIQPGQALAFNATVRRAADDAWLMWNGTGAQSWVVERAGTITLAD